MRGYISIPAGLPGGVKNGSGNLPQRRSDGASDEQNRIGGKNGQQ